MLEKFHNHIEKKLPFLKEKKLLIAISGGVDSVVLTHLFHQLKHNIALAHCNFQLRGNESDKDEASIIELGKKLDITFFTTKFDTKAYAKKNKLSTQLAARELRYTYFEEIIAAHNYDFILTAHHLDDNVETFLINLSRGTGLEGLTGIPVKNKKVIRPLLVFSRKQILTYAKANNILWREDQSNSEKKYLRNKIRHDIIPTLKEINPQFLNNFNKTNDFLNQSQQIIEDRIDSIYESIVSKDDEVLKFDVQKILNLNEPKTYLYQLLKNYGFKEWNNVFELLYAQSGKRIESQSHVLLKNRAFLLLSDKKNIETKTDKVYLIENSNATNLHLPVKLILEKTNKITDVNKKTILVNKKLVFYPLLIRRRKTGDFFYPKGMKGKKKLSKFFKDEKMSTFDKNNTWLLCDAKDQIIWIIGKRQDRRFEVNNDTKYIIKISI